ncbi:MAG: hypothetical protein IPH35_03000 [Rhodoferax sp.]|nr:hypothetical protein [Rhodoferax sp.]
MDTAKKSNNPVVRFECAGGCGKFQMVRPSKISKADFYVCNSICQSRIPPRLPGQIVSIEFGACGGFNGVSYKWPDSAEIESLERARNIKFAGLAQLVLEKAKN